MKQTLLLQNLESFCSSKLFDDFDILILVYIPLSASTTNHWNKWKRHKEIFIHKLRRKLCRYGVIHRNNSLRPFSPSENVWVNVCLFVFACAIGTTRGESIWGHPLKIHNKDKQLLHGVWHQAFKSNAESYSEVKILVYIAFDRPHFLAPEGITGWLKQKYQSLLDLNFAPV